MEIIIYSFITLGVMGIGAGVLLYYTARKFSVPVDSRVEEITQILPGANCGACGYASCRALARAIIEEAASPSSCIAGGAVVADKIADILGREKEPGTGDRKVAVVQCRGGCDKAGDRFKYTGLQDCRAAVLTGGGPKACSYGCLGLGSCVTACPFGALDMGPDGIPVVDEDKCTGCGKCVAVCPRGIIALIPRWQNVFLGCVSHDKLKKVKEVCSVGCIACGLCVRPGIGSEEDIIMEDNLPRLRPRENKDLAVALDQAIAKCPSKCFVVRGSK